MWAALFLACATAATAGGESPADPVPVPGGPAAVRSLLGLDPSRPAESFFLDLHAALLAGAEWNASWSQVERRRKVVDFSDDLADFRGRFGRDVTLTLSNADRQRTRRVLDWIGVAIDRRGEEFASETRDDARSIRRRAAFDAVGFPLPVLLTRLKNGESVRVAPADGVAPLPFGVAAWRELLDDAELSAGGVFMELVKNVEASRLLVTLHAIDPETRDGLRAIARGGRASFLLDEDVLDRLARFPGALAMNDGEIVLPGGRDADPIWTDVFGVPPARPSAFLRALFEKDGGRGAYFVEVLQQLPEPVARALLFGPPGAEAHAVARARKLYRAVEGTRKSIELSRRDLYDFGHLARLLRTGPDGDIALYPLDLDGETFPEGESQLAGIVARATKRAEAPEDALVRLISGEVGDGRDAPRAARRFLVVSSLVEGRPGLADPGVMALLLRGFDRFGSAYAPLEDPPFQEAALARRYLFTVDRLDSRKPSREAEVGAALFQAAVEITAASYRAGTLDDAQTRELFSGLLDQPLFARSDVSPAKGVSNLFAWLSGRLLPAIEAGEQRAIASRAALGLAEPSSDDPDEEAPEGAEEDPSDAPDEGSLDERLTRGLAGFPPPAVFEWSGGHYRFDPASDEVLRRRKFRDKQRLATLEDVAAVGREREALVAAAGRGDAAALRVAAATLVDRLSLSANGGSAGPREDERVLQVRERAEESLERLTRIAKPTTAAQLEKDLAAVDAATAERLVEALVGHVYAAAAGDPDDLYYEDPDFVRRHSFRSVEKGGRRVESAFSQTALSSEATGGGYRVTGSLFGLADVLGLLHADQITYAPGASIANDSIRSGLVGPVRRMSPARLDGDALRFVAAACRATEEFARTVATRQRGERFRVWRAIARDLVPRSRLASLAELEADAASNEALARFLSPSDLYRIGRRLALDGMPESLALPEAAVTAREALARLAERHGAAGSRARLAEFGPRAVAWAGRMRLADLDMPPYESLAAYRTPQLFGDRLYDWKIAIARAVFDAGLPAGILPLVLPRAVDEMMSDLRMAFPYDWNAIVRRSNAFGSDDLARLLDEGLQAGRLLRDHARDSRRTSQ